MRSSIVVLFCALVAGCGGGGAGSTSGSGGGTTASIDGSCTYTACSFSAATNEAGAFSWSWTFGDGGTATGKSVTHTYSKANTYTVKVTILGSGTQVSASKTVTVTLQPVVAAFTEDCNFLACTFDASTTKVNDGGSVKKYTWTFGDGTGSTSEAPSHTYTSGGGTTVTLTVDDSTGATDTDSQDLDIGNLGVQAQAIQTTVQMALSYDNYGKVLDGIDGFARTEVKNHGPITPPGSAAGPTLSCPGAGTIGYQYWTDTDSDGIPDNKETYALVNPKACAYKTGSQTFTGIETHASTAGTLSGATTFLVYGDGTVTGSTEGTVTSNEDGWVTYSNFAENVAVASGTLSVGVSDANGNTSFDYLNNDGLLAANPYGADSFPQNEGISPLNSGIPFGAFSDDRRQPTCSGTSGACTILVTDATDTESIAVNMEWGFTGSADGKTKAPAISIFSVATTTNWDVETSGGKTYMKSGSFTVVGFADWADYNSDTQAWSVTVTASGTAGDPTFDVSVDGGTAFTIPQSNWVSYPHVCGSMEIGYGCTPSNAN